MIFSRLPNFSTARRLNHGSALASKINYNLYGNYLNYDYISITYRIMNCSPASKIRSFGVIIVAIASLVSFESASAVGLMVNEYRTGTGTGVTAKMARDDFIEFVLTTNATAAELAALTFGDTNTTTSRLNSVFRFDQTTLDLVLTNAGQTSFLAGTFIVVKGTGLGAQNLTYDPRASTIGNTDAWSIELVAGQGARDHTTTVVNGNLNLDRNGEVVWVSTDNPPVNSLDTSSFISAIGHDNNLGAVATAVRSQFGVGSILGAVYPTARTISNVGGSTVSLAASTTSTLGAPNGAANASWIQGSLQVSAVPEPGRAGLCLLAAAVVLTRRRRTISSTYLFP
jgi:hypothetical protein